MTSVTPQTPASTARPASTFAHILRHQRRAAGLTQEEVAERSGVSVRTISALERGVHHAPHSDTVVLLAEALGLSSTLSKLNCSKSAPGQ